MIFYRRAEGKFHPTINQCVNLVNTTDSNPDDPPTVEIYNQDFIAVDSIYVDDGEMFTLFSAATGNNPLSYYWYLTDLMISVEPAQSDYSISNIGSYPMISNVIDFHGLSGADTCYVIVEQGPVPIKETTWGKIKNIFN